MASGGALQIPHGPFHGLPAAEGVHADADHHVNPAAGAELAAAVHHAPAQGAHAGAVALELQRGMRAITQGAGIGGQAHALAEKDRLRESFTIRREAGERESGGEVADARHDLAVELEPRGGGSRQGARGAAQGRAHRCRVDGIEVESGGARMAAIAAEQGRGAGEQGDEVGPSRGAGAAAREAGGAFGPEQRGQAGALKNLAGAIALILEDRRKDGLRGVPASATREKVVVG